MTETANFFPAGRYGHRREARRRRPWIPALLLVVVLVAATMIAVRLYRQYGNPAYTPELKKYQISDRSVTVNFDVIKPDGSAAICGVRARSYDGREVGSAEVDIPGGTGRQGRTAVTYVLPTTARAFAVDVPRCAPAGQR